MQPTSYNQNVPMVAMLGTSSFSCTSMSNAFLNFPAVQGSGYQAMAPDIQGYAMMTPNIAAPAPPQITSMLSSISSSIGNTWSFSSTAALTTTGNMQQQHVSSYMTCPLPQQQPSQPGPPLPAAPTPTPRKAQIEAIPATPPPQTSRTVESTESGRENEQALRDSKQSKKAFVCSHCERTFSRRSNLKRHFRVHTGERPYQCRYCVAAFKQSSSLKTHVLIHTGEKPFECNVCCKRFRHRNSLRSHERTQHPVDQKGVKAAENLKRFSPRVH